jgi:hypothetical protein
MQRSISIVTTLELIIKFSDVEELTKASHMLSLFPSLQVLGVLVSIELCTFSLCISSDLFTVKSSTLSKPYYLLLV